MGSIGAVQKEISRETLYQAEEYANRFRGAVVDREARKIVIPFMAGTKEADITGTVGLGTWFTQNGFKASYEVRDYEYETKNGTSTFGGGWRPKKVYLRNRLVGTYTW